MTRSEDGVLEVTIHSDGESLRWGPVPHAELCRAFHDIGDDRENRVVILTGVGDEFTGPICSPDERPLGFRPHRLSGITSILTASTFRRIY
jgi:hypothetical protein